MSKPQANGPAIIFDLGKVLVDFDFRIAARKLAHCTAGSVEDIRFLIQESEHLCAFETGLISTAEFAERIVARIGFSGTQAEFGRVFADIFTPIPAMIQLQQDLRAHGLPTYIFSNTNELAVNHIRRTFEFFNHFSGYVLSYEQRVMKPDARIYEVVERTTGRQGAQLVYFDDRPENIAAAEKRGWRAHVHEATDKTLRIVRTLGLL